jgi:prepilin-type N-terminal cleavage/methylation domain-containing protein
MKMISLQHSQARRPNRYSSGRKGINFSPCGRGFTIIEILIVVVIIAIAAMMAVPMVGSADSMQVRSAANVIAADIEYARSMAISRQKTYSVVFNESNESYQLEDSSGIIEHPVKKGFQYVVNFGSSSQLNKIDIVDASFGGASRISFSPAGAPSSGGVIQLQAGGTIATISVEPVTGFIMISD